ncbi:MAG: LUD domain-containing protein [Bacteroidales bacterium]
MKMSDRDKILSAIRQANQGLEIDRPASEGVEILAFKEPLAQACRMVEAVGGEVVRFDRPTGFDMETGLRELVEQMRPGCEVFFAINRGMDDFERRPVEVLVVAGSFLVAENGAVWVNSGQTGSASNRSLLFLAEHLMLVVGSANVVGTMHEACKRIRGDQSAYGTFISGPSKTADIEQALVIGAQGPRRMTLILT